MDGLRMWLLSNVFISANCEWGPWTGGPCSATCGQSGIQNNKRIKTRIEKDGGKCLGSSTVTIGCNRIKCPSTIYFISFHLTFSILSKDNRLWRRRRQFVVTWRGIRSSRIHSSVRGQVSWAGSWLVHWLQLSSHCLTQCGIGSLQL